MELPLLARQSEEREQGRAWPYRSILKHQVFVAVSSAIVFCVPKMTLSRPPPIIASDTWEKKKKKSREETDKMTKGEAGL